MVGDVAHTASSAQCSRPRGTGRSSASPRTWCPFPVGQYQPLLDPCIITALQWLPMTVKGSGRPTASCEGRSTGLEEEGDTEPSRDVLSECV